MPAFSGQGRGWIWRVYVAKWVPYIADNQPASQPATYLLAVPRLWSYVRGSLPDAAVLPRSSRADVVCMFMLGFGPGQSYMYVCMFELIDCFSRYTVSRCHCLYVKDMHSRHAQAHQLIYISAALRIQNQEKPQSRPRLRSKPHATPQSNILIHPPLHHHHHTLVDIA
jgi:hypothetical protein